MLACVSFLVLNASSELYSQRKPKTVLDRAEKALGDKRAVKNLESRIKKGLITRLSDGATGEVVIQTSKPDNFNLSFDIRGFETEIGYNGRSGWLRDSREGLRTLTGDRSRDLKAEALYRNWRWTEYKKHKLKITANE